MAQFKSSNKSLAPAHHIRSLNKGDDLDEFKVKHFVGRGKSNTAHIYALESDAALKLFVMEKGTADFKFRLYKFVGEAKALKELEGSNHVVRIIAEYRDEAEHNGKKVPAHYFVMEMLDTNLDDYLLNNLDAPLINKIEILEQIVMALIEIHGKEIYHRDIYTPNILMKKSGNDYLVKIGDFGSAKMYAESSTDEYFMPTGITTYSSPEACSGLLGGNAAPKELYVGADCYSLGLLMYEVFTGTPLNDICTALYGLCKIAGSKGLFSQNATAADKDQFYKTFAVGVLKSLPKQSIILKDPDEHLKAGKLVNELVTGLTAANHVERLKDMSDIQAKLENIKESLK